VFGVEHRLDQESQDVVGQVRPVVGVLAHDQPQQLPEVFDAILDRCLPVLTRRQGRPNVEKRDRRQHLRHPEVDHVLEVAVFRVVGPHVVPAHPIAFRI